MSKIKAQKNGWRGIKLEEVICSNQKSIDKNFTEKTIQYLDTGSITEGKIDSYQFFPLRDAPSRAKRLVKDQDIIYSTVRPIQRHYGFLKNPPNNLVVSTGFSVITVKKEFAEPLFIYYLLTSKEVVEEFDVIAEGATSAYPSLKPSDIERLDIFLSSLSEQKAIAEVLSSLDDKIDLLHRQNKTLEKMAQTLFRKWFVEDAEKGEKVGKLGDYVSCINGVSYKSDDLNPSKVAMITLKNFDRNGDFRLDGFKEYTGKYKEQHIVKQNDLVIAHTDITQDAAIIGNPVLVVDDDNYDKLVFSMDLVKVVSQYEWLSNEFLYLLMKTQDFKQHCLGVQMVLPFYT